MHPVAEWGGNLLESHLLCIFPGTSCPVLVLPPSSGEGKQVLARDIYTSLNTLPTSQTFLNECAVQLLPVALCFRSSDSHLFDKVRGYDIKLLRYLSVKYICDLMVENKKVKFGMK